LKLTAYGISGKIYEWIKSYLSDRKQRIVMGDKESNWVSVISGVPQGSVLAPLLFLIYINDLPDQITNTCKLYADDNKVISRANSESDKLGLQRDINSLNEWSEKWQIKFNIKKCHVMQFGKDNSNQFNYQMSDSSGTYDLEYSKEERDIGVIISNSLKFGSHINLITSKANRMLGLILNTFLYLNLESFRQLYCTFVRSQLEFAMSAWNPHLKKDIATLEAVQRRATKKAPGLNGLCYEERLKRLNLTSLEERRVRGDLIQQFKIVNGYDKVKWHKNPHISTENNHRPMTRGHRFKITKENTKDNIRLNFFKNRIANDWNALSNEIVEANTINSFKARIDKLYVSNGSYKTKKLT
jgi:hypothetical protein